MCVCVCVCVCVCARTRTHKGEKKITTKLKHEINTIKFLVE